jgi:lipoprotein-anchoring transpeptidase ErfK/SrfK
VTRALGTAVVVVLVADIAVALTPGSVAAHPHHRGATVLRSQADIVGPGAVVGQTGLRSPSHSAAHHAAARRIAAVMASQTAHRQAPHRAVVTKTAPTLVPRDRRVGTRTHTVRSTATTPGVKPGDVGKVSTGGLVSGSAPKKDLAKIPTITYLATMRHRAPGFKSATAKHKSMTVPRNWYGRTSVLPIVDATKKRVEVRLARRPNESTTWLRLSAINFGYSVQAILIDVSQRRLYVFNKGKQKYSFPIGVGRPQTPTPPGTFFLAFHAPPNSPEYGSVMLETSAHSTVFRTFEGGNDAIIAIHGPIGSDAAIGKNGAAISNGCIRMHNSQLVKAAHVEDGSPIIITH